jgi:hypothetical protein
MFLMQGRRASWPKTTLKRLEVLILIMQQAYQSSSTISSDSPMVVIVPTEHPSDKGLGTRPIAPVRLGLQ